MESKSAGWAQIKTSSRLSVTRGYKVLPGPVHLEVVRRTRARAEERLSEGAMPGAFNAGIATIFAREQLEACIIIGQYRMVVMRSDWEEARKKAALKAIWMAAAMAGLAAVMVIMCVAIPVKLLGGAFEDGTAKVIEGISKVIAAVCILQLSLKLPYWLGVYRKEDEHEVKLGLTLRELRFNVAWNIWREIAELGVFLIPSFLSGDEVRRRHRKRRRWGREHMGRGLA